MGRSPKEEEARGPPGCWCRSVGPESPKTLPARRPRKFAPARAHLWVPAGLLHSITRLGPCTCPILATAGARMSEAVLLRRSLSPSFSHRKWWLGEGHQWEVQQEDQKLLLDS